MGIRFCRVCGEVDVIVRDEVDSVIVFGTSVCGRDCMSFCVSDSVGMSIRLVVRLLSRDEVCVSVSAGVSVCDWVWDGEWVCVSVRI